jgi:hypothetical protein
MSDATSTSAESPLKPVLMLVSNEECTLRQVVAVVQAAQIDKESIVFRKRLQVTLGSR